MRIRVLPLVSVLAIAACGSGITQEELDQAVADAVAAATDTTAPPPTAPAPTTTAPLPTTTVQRSISEIATKGRLTYDRGILKDGSCTQIVREIESIVGSLSRGERGLALSLGLADPDPEVVPALKVWSRFHLQPAADVIGTVAGDHNLPLHLTAYARDVRSAVFGLYLVSSTFPTDFSEYSVSQWVETDRTLSEAVRNYPPCED